MPVSRLSCALIATLSLLLLIASPNALAEDWPTFRHDTARSGITKEKLSLPLAECWTFESRYKPKPAFGLGYPLGTNWEGGVEKRRIDFDRADSVIAVGESVYFGSVGDGKVYCLDAKTAKVRWTFATAGPVRLAPTHHEGRIYVGSDDGCVYCLDAEQGTEIWKFRAAPDDWRVIGNDHLISLWPVRTGVMVEDGIAYFGAGIFPSEGVFLYAVDAKTGKTIWKNDRGSEIRMGQISPQGYLLASEKSLVVPMSRLAPGIYDRQTGRFKMKLSIYYGGGTFAAMDGSRLYSGCEAAHCFPVDEDELPLGHGTSKSLASFPGGQLVAAPGMVYSCGAPRAAGVSKAIVAFKWTPPAGTEPAKDARRGKAEPIEKPEQMWTCDFDTAEALILAGDTLFVGGVGRVAAVSAAEGKILWSSNIDGTALSLTVAAGRLYVSTDKGRVHCFAAANTPNIGKVAEPVAAAKPAAAKIKNAADKALQGVPTNQKGFVLVYGVETGELAVEIARRTQFTVRAISPDEKKVAAARKLADEAGLLGGRIVVEQWPLENVPYTKYFADLIVSETALQTGQPVGSAVEVLRMTKPIRGKIAIGSDSASGENSGKLTAWLANSPLADAKIDKAGGAWATFTRPPLEGARAWSNQYGTPGATGSSEDERVKGPFRIQWFGNPGPKDLVDRHYWAAAPLAYEGRMFVCSYKSVTAYDVYTGMELWQYPLENATRAHIADVPSNVCIGPDGYFVAVDETCYRLDPATGKLLSKYTVPTAPNGDRRMWGYVACADGVLIGSRTLGYLPMQEWRKSRGDDVIKWLLSDVLFGVDVASGKLVWEYKTDWFRHNSVTLAPVEKDTDGKEAAEKPDTASTATIFISHPGVTQEQQDAAIAEAKPYVDKFPGKPAADRHGKPIPPYVELIAAIDVKTGKPRWQRGVDWSACGGQRGTLIYTKGRLLQLSDVGGCKAFKGYPLENNIGRAITVRDAYTGDIMWLKPLNYRSRAVVVGETIIAEPWAYNLKTGEQKMVKHPATEEQVPWAFVRPEKHCGPFNASAHTLFFRNGGFGYCDVERNEGVARFESSRPSCWLSFISAEGLALWPSGDSGCRCGLAIACSMGLVHDDRAGGFADFTAPGELLPVKSLAVNLGALGDRRDEEGRLWLGFPRESYTSAIELPAKAEFHDGGEFVSRNSEWTPSAKRASPWQFTSAAKDVKDFRIKLRRPQDGAAKYRVELLFASLADEKAGERVFDVKLQGQVVQANLDIVAQAGGSETALVLAFDDISVKDDLVVELVPRSGAKPLLSGLRVEVKP